MAAAGARPVASKVVTIEGRSVTVQVDLWRDMMPGIGGNGGKMATAISFRTSDSRQLPAIGTVKVTFEKSAGATWSPRLQAVPTFAYDPMSAMYSASGGPKWTLNSRVTAKVTYTAGGRTRRVDIPVRVAGVY